VVLVAQSVGGFTAAQVAGTGGAVLQIWTTGAA
jgi:hypothetical protein